jgi:hypothetical protein
VNPDALALLFTKVSLACLGFAWRRSILAA